MRAERIKSALSSQRKGAFAPVQRSSVQGSKSENSNANSGSAGEPLNIELLNLERRPNAAPLDIISALQYSGLVGGLLENVHYQMVHVGTKL
jgi:hypothetical protein